MSFVSWILATALVGAPVADNGTTAITSPDAEEAEASRTDNAISTDGPNSPENPSDAPDRDDPSNKEESSPVPARAPTPSVEPTPAARTAPTEVVLLPAIPPRPDRTGFGLFVGSGLLAGLSITQQVFALQLALAQGTCEDEFLSADADMDGTVDLNNNLGLVCLFGPQFVGFVRAGANVEMLGAAGLLAAGMAMRGQVHAYDHHYFGVPLRGKRRNLLIAGGVLTGVAAVGWLTTRIVLVATPACDGGLVCTTLVDSVATDVSAIIGATGVGMLSYAIARERALHRYRTMKPRFTILPAGGPGLAAISLSGRF